MKEYQDCRSGMCHGGQSARASLVRTRIHCYVRSMCKYACRANAIVEARSTTPEEKKRKRQENGLDFNERDVFLRDGCEAPTSGGLRHSGCLGLVVGGSVK
jgi:hypothetical protein